MTGPSTATDGRIQKRNGAPGEGMTLAAFIRQPAMMREIQNALPKHLNPDRMIRIVLTALRTTPNLATCNDTSFMACVLQAAQLGLECNTPLGHAYLVPRRNNKLNTMECTLLVGYQGMIELALRSGKVTSIKARVVRKGDTFTFEDGLRPVLRHVESDAPDRESKAITHAWAVAHIKDGEPVFVVLSRAQIDARRDRSSSKTGPWQSDYEAMAAKTAVRALFKWIPKSSDMALVEHMEDQADKGAVQAQAFDGAVKQAMRDTGLEPIDDLPMPAHDPETGEILDAAGESVPAQGG